MCVYKSGDVIGLTLSQLIEVPEITRILIADGPHLGPIKPGYFAEKPTVKEVVDGFKSTKLFYEYTNDLPHRAKKNNHILKHTTNDCKWILCVDSDEVYHEKDLIKLIEFLKKSPPYDRYKIKTINPFPDFHHEIRFSDYKPRLYRYKKGYKCPDSDRSHQFVFGPGQKKCPKDRSICGSLWQNGTARLSPEICQIYHLNALRPKNSKRKKRVEVLKDGTVIRTGGGNKVKSSIYPLDINEAPKCIRNLKRDTL